MPDATLADLLERNARHVESLSADHFDSVQTAQEPAVVSVCCSDSRVSQEGMWDVEEAGWLFTVGNIGNQVREDHAGEAVVAGDVIYPIRFTGTDVAAVVGHTGCGAVTAALEAARGEGGDVPPGVEARVESLLPVVEDGLEDDRVGADADPELVDQLVEYNVDRQVAFLRASEDVPASVTVVGFVYDFLDSYGDARGRCYLVNLDGETDVGALEERVPHGYESHVRRLLEG